MDLFLEQAPRRFALELNHLMLNIGHPHPVGLAGRVAHVVAVSRYLAADITFARQFSFTPFTKYFFCCIIYHELNPAHSVGVTGRIV